jgi:hypothetical protein
MRKLRANDPGIGYNNWALYAELRMDLPSVFGRQRPGRRYLHDLSVPRSIECGGN